jgi:hypothetical protein
MSSYKILSFPSSATEVGPYLGLIISNWLTTQKYTNEWFKLIDEEIYFSTYGQFIRSILARPACKVNLAVLSDNEDVCIGFCVYENQTIHYWFVRRYARKEKIGTSLLPKDFTKISHVTLPGVIIWKNKFPKVIFDPFLT